MTGSFAGAPASDARRPGTAPATRRVTVLLHLEQTPPAHGDVLVSAAMQLFTAADAVDLGIRLVGVSQPVEADAEALGRRCAEVCPHPQALPEIVLLAQDEEPEHPVVLELRQDDDVAATARSVILLAALAQELWGDDRSSAPTAASATLQPVEPAPNPAPAPTPSLAKAPALVLRDPALGGTGEGGDTSLTARLNRLSSAARTTPIPTQATAATAGDASPYLRAMRTSAIQRLGMVDAGRRDRIGADGPIHAAVLVQHLDSWGALDTIARALRDHPRVRFDLVALDSSLSRFPGETAAVLAKAGFATRDEAWLRAALPDLDVLVLCDGYDEFRPDGLRVPDFAAAGVRLVYSPYGTNIGGEETQERRQYDGLLHNVAWRVFAPTIGQRDLFARRCTAGDGHVRTVGSVKRERVLALREDPSPGEALRAATGSATTVLWNPHFTITEDGWSTFLTHLEPLLGFFASTRRDLGLIIRPHFRLLLDLATIPALAPVNRRFREACERQRNVVLDDSRDYLPAFAAADAMISDQSSLIPEYLPLRRPVLYLHRPGGAPLNSDAAFMAALPAAETWTDLAGFLGDVATGRAAAPDAAAIGEEHLGARDGGAGSRVARTIVTDLLTELDLPELPAPADLPVALDR